MSRVLPIVCLLAIAVAAAFASAAPTTRLEEARQSMRDRDFDQAVAQLDKTLAAPDAQHRDEAGYLKALALSQAKQYDKAILAADAALTRFPDSPWTAKTIFLKAQCLIQLRRFTDAEKIYEQQTHSLLSADRKAEIAQVLIDFAEQLCAKPDPAKPDAPQPEYAKAYQLLGKVSDMEIGLDLRDQVMFRRAQVIALAKNFGQAVNDYQQYLQRFDPTWGRAPDQVADVEPRASAGRHIHEARLGLAVAQIQTGNGAEARRQLEDLLRLLDQSSPMRADVRWQIIRSYSMPECQAWQLDPAVTAIRAFLADFPADSRAVVAAWWIPQALSRHGRGDDAIAAYEDFIESRNHKLPQGDALHAKLDDFDASPRKLSDDGRMKAVFEIAQIRFNQKKYDQAIAAWSRYVAQFPNGPQWSAAQNSIITAEFQQGIDQVADGHYEQARAMLDRFIAAHPLDPRCPQIQFLYAQMAVQQARSLEEAKQPADQIDAACGGAIDTWRKLAEKYPDTDEASLSLYRIADLYETKLHQLDRAIETYRRVTFGQWAGPARQRLAAMTGKHLSLATARAFLTTEQPQVTLDVRNIEKVTVRQYRLDLEAYFRKTHETGRVEQLDIALIQPDKTWELPVGEYAKYKPITQKIDVPCETNHAGVYLVNVASDDWEATTLVIRSDIDLIVQSTRGQVLVYVQNIRTGAPAKGADVLVSIAGKVVAAAQTAADGVCVVDAPTLKDSDNVRVFASLDGSVASYGVNLTGLETSGGLQPRGYLYTDRPAYLPGQPVGFRGILRDVADGRYQPPVDQQFTFDVLDPAGRVIWSEDLAANKFGSIRSRFNLDADAPVGQYSLRVQRKDQPAAPVFTGNFQVQQFTLEKMRLTLTTPEDVYFRGQVIHWTIDAQYTFGQPLAGRLIRYQLPDGRTLTGRTDDKGKLTVDFDTTAMTPGSTLTLRAMIDGENVRAAHTVLLANLGFDIALKPARDIVLAGEPVDLKVTTKTPAGKPTAQELTLTILRRQVRQADPVLAAVPWLGSEDALDFAQVSTQKLKTDATGKAVVSLKLEQGGQYTFRVSGSDAFNQPVSNETSLEVSDDKDATQLRIFADTTTLQVGSAPIVRVHNRLGQSLALVLINGDTFIEHRVIPLADGYNDLPLKIDHAHYPNFRLTVAVMRRGHFSGPDQGRGELHEAAVPFTVERQLNVTVKPLNDIYQPGEKGKVELTVTDQLGKPVEAELSLAMVDASLFNIHPDDLPDILTFFQQDAHRDDDLRSGSTIDFHYESTTKAVNKQIAGEADRLIRTEDETRQLDMLREETAKRSSSDSVREVAQQRAGAARAPAAPMSITTTGISGGALFSADAKLEIAEKLKSGAKDDLNGYQGGEGGRGLTPRRELPGAGVWLPDVVTDARGKAVAEITMPQKTTQWRITTRGITPQTLAGQATATLITRKDFFVDLKLPATLMQGDHFAPIARVHNLSDNAGTVELSLVIKDSTGEKTLAEQKRTVKIDKNADAEFAFDPVEVPTGTGLRVELRASLGKLDDALVRTVAVRPWGIEYAAHHGGVSDTDVTSLLTLPGKGDLQLSIYVGPSLQQSIIDWALRDYPMPLDSCMIAPPSWGSTSGGELLAVVSALDYARAVHAAAVDIDRLTRRVMQLVQTLTVTQRADGAWADLDAANPWATSAMSFWALARAKSLGFTIENRTMELGQKYLLEAFRKVDANDNDAKAAILHALSLVGQADFANINRLHRERNTLSNPALAYTALALVNQKRPDIAGELLDVLIQRAQYSGGDIQFVYWTGSDKQSMLADNTQATALVTLAFAKVRPQSNLLASAVAWLTDQRGCFDWTPASARGPVLAALGEYYRSAQPVDAQYKLDVLVNGKPVTTVNVKGAAKPQLIAVPAEAIIDGKNIVELRKSGPGRFTWAATLRRFSSDLTDPNSFKLSVNLRRYHHDELTYNGRSIGAESTSPVKHIEIGQRVQVWLDIMYNNYPYDGYLMIVEPIPAGMTLARDSIQSNAVRVDVADDRITFFYPPRTYIHDIRYQLVGYATGDYRILPTVMRDPLRPDRMRVAKPDQLTVLKPGETSDDPYQMNPGERFALGRLNFDDGHYTESLKYLGELFKQYPQYNERDLARMLLWIATSDGFYDAQRIVQTFEILRERYPELEIPFDKILVVGKAYRDLGEMERACAVFRATLDVSFANDASISAVLEDEGQFLASIDYSEDLWRQYPDTAATSSAYFALSQSLYRMAPRAAELAKRSVRGVRLPGHAAPAENVKVSRVDLLKQTSELLESFLTLYPDSPLADDAAFSLSNAYLDLTLYPRVVALSQRFAKLYADSDFASGFQYMQALGYFRQRDYAPALKAAMLVADGKSRDKELATYIVGQIFHAQGEPAKAIDWYTRVADQYTDAKEAIDYFKQQTISLEEVHVFRPGKPVKLTLKYRNIAQAAIQVYRVDLMKLYLREKNLTRVTAVNLAGIAPLTGQTLTLGDGRDYVDKQREFDLALKDEGAYLLIVRGDDLFTSALVLVTPLELKVQEEAAGGRVRVNVMDAVKNQYVANVHVKAIGSANADFKGGETDLRGIYIADAINGKVTVIARDGESRYAFYRGEQWLGRPADAPHAGPGRMPAERQAAQMDYQENLRKDNSLIQGQNFDQFDKLRRNAQKGVQIKQAY
ncbi:MAG: MG2 domain-containing protein [Phycisphaerales bacterium]